MGAASGVNIGLVNIILGAQRIIGFVQSITVEMPHFEVQSCVLLKNNFLF